MTCTHDRDITRTHRRETHRKNNSGMELVFAPLHAVFIMKHTSSVTSNSFFNRSHPSSFEEAECNSQQSTTELLNRKVIFLDSKGIFSLYSEASPIVITSSNFVIMKQMQKRPSGFYLHRIFHIFVRQKNHLIPLWVDM